MKETRICILGGGGRLWPIQFMKDLAFNPATKGRVVLYDIDYKAAQNNVEVGNRIMSLNKSGDRFVVEANDNLKTALSGSDIVIISIEPGKTEARYADLILPEKYGILQSVGDTTGPGGIIRARRALPIFFEFGRLIKEHCPEAWVINYTNPMTLCTAALYKVFPEIKALGCCHEVFHTQNYLAKRVGEWFDIDTPDRREIKIDLCGVNHFTFATSAYYKGEELLFRLKEEVKDSKTFPDLTEVALKRLKEEKWFECDQKIALSFLKEFGVLGAAGDRHLAEFVPYYLDSDETLHRYGVIRTPYAWRERVAQEKRNKSYEDKELIAERSDEEGVDIMSALLGDFVMVTNINRPNEGQISYLPLGRIVESNGVISENSIRPIIASDPPMSVQTMIRRVSDVQELTLEAIYNNDDEALFEAFISDPLMTLNLKDARGLFEQMIEESDKRM